VLRMLEMLCKFALSSCEFLICDKSLPLLLFLSDEDISWHIYNKIEIK
jgi:hypothetical protein